MDMNYDPAVDVILSNSSFTIIGSAIGILQSSG